MTGNLPKKTTEGNTNFEIVQYAVPGTGLSVDVHLDTDTKEIWATSAAIADIFGTTSNNIEKHLRNIFKEGEIDRETNRKKTPIRLKTMGYNPPFEYNIDVIIAVGYRVNSKTATQFRKWSTKYLADLIRDGFAIDEARVLESERAQEKLVDKVRAIRTEETSLYKKVTNAVKVIATDYDTSHEDTKKFFAEFQDTFHYSVTEKTAAELVIDRCDHTQDNCGLVTWTGKKGPTKGDAKTGKNYLSPDELKKCQRLSESFLNWVEDIADQEKCMPMKGVHGALMRLIEWHERPKFTSYSAGLRNKADTHAEKQIKLYEESKQPRLL